MVSMAVVEYVAVYTWRGVVVTRVLFDEWKQDSQEGGLNRDIVWAVGVMFCILELLPDCAITVVVRTKSNTIRTLALGMPYVPQSSQSRFKLVEQQKRCLKKPSVLS